MPSSNTNLLVLDVGNTNTSVGVFHGKTLRAQWRLTTSREQTADEYGILIRNLFSLDGLGTGEVTGVMVASVVPPLNAVLEEMSRKYFRLDPVFLGPGTRTGIAIHYDNPQEVGADRIANSVAAIEKYGVPVVRVGLAIVITFDVILHKVRYASGL